MTETARAKGRQFAKFLENLPEDVRICGNEDGLRKSQLEYQRFLSSLKKAIAISAKNRLHHLVKNYLVSTGF